jgi:rhamnosyltransferase
LVHDVRVDVHHAPRPVLCCPCRDRPQQFGRLPEIDGDVKQRRRRPWRGDRVAVAVRIAKRIGSHIGAWYACQRRVAHVQAECGRTVSGAKVKREIVVSVIVRTRDEAAGVGRCLELVRSQQMDGATVELIVVDSGSRDETVEIARKYGATVLTTEPEPFSFGGALNAGAASAHGSVLVALSAHAFPLDSGWLSRLVAPFSDPAVACVSADRYLPDGTPLRGAVRQDLALLRSEPEWGYSNAAGAFRASLWRERPFRVDLPGAEDREWSLHWIQQGYVCVVDPALLVDHDHTHDPVPAIYRRARREAEGFAMFLAQPPYGIRELAGEWWSDRRFYSSRLRARLSHRRAARLVGTYVGRKQGTRRAQAAGLPRF